MAIGRAEDVRLWKRDVDQVRAVTRLPACAALLVALLEQRVAKSNEWLGAGDDYVMLRRSIDISDYMARWD